jgi:hypothetical protein
MRNVFGVPGRGIRNVSIVCDSFFVLFYPRLRIIYWEGGPNQALFKRQAGLSYAWKFVMGTVLRFCVCKRLRHKFLSHEKRERK